LAEYVIAKYIRLSMEDAKTDSLSVENQRLLLDWHIDEMNIPGAEVLEFVDNGHTGLTFERPAVQELLELVQAGHVNCIIVKDFSRFGRNLLEAGYYIERVFPLYRVRFISISDGFDSNEHEGGTGGLDVAFKLLLHEQYSRDLSRKIKAAKRARALRGESISKNCAFGFKKVNGRLEIDAPAAGTVRLIFEMYKDGFGLSEIAARLRGDKRPTSGEYKKRTPNPSCSWNTAHIFSILRDEQYIGTYIAGKTRCVEVGSGKSVPVDESNWIRIPGHHLAIVERTVFDAVRERIDQKHKARRKRKPSTRKPSGFGDHMPRGTAIQVQANSTQLEQRAQAEAAKRVLYEKFILGEIDAKVFKESTVALDERLICQSPSSCATIKLTLP